jgi:hypothetical protein
MYLTRIVLSIVFVLFASTALAAKPDKTLVCHVGNELGSMGETYMDNPDCTIPPEWVGDPADYKCPDAGKIDLILVSTKAKHIGNEAHSFGDDSDYAPVLDDVGDDPADFEDNTSPPDGIDDGCETEELLTCPCFTAEEANAIADGEVTYCSSHPTETTWAALTGTDGSTGVEETMHTAANPDPYWQRCSFDAVGSTDLYLRNLTLDEVAACYTIISDLIAAKGLEPVSGSYVCQPFK